MIDFRNSGYSGGGTCRNRALGDTFLKFGMELEQAMRFSKTTGYKLTHAAVGCSCENKTANDGHQIRHASASMDCIFKYNTNFVLFLSMGNGC